jgi:hypothetical protein
MIQATLDAGNMLAVCAPAGRSRSCLSENLARKLVAIQNQIAGTVNAGCGSVRMPMLCRGLVRLLELGFTAQAACLLLGTSAHRSSTSRRDNDGRRDAHAVQLCFKSNVLSCTKPNQPQQYSSNFARCQFKTFQAAAAVRERIHARCSASEHRSSS